MALVTAGKMNKQIACELGLSEVTINFHRSAGMRKMGARSLAELVRMADTVKNRTESAHPGAFVTPTAIFSGQLGRNQQMVAGHLISIVDDDNSMREALVRLVRSLGCDVRDFASAEDFLASDDLRQFACAIIDIQMPGMDDFQLKRERGMRHGSLPVIMITARIEPGIEEKARSSGATSLLRKPFEAKTLVNCLRRVLGGV
jgi:FixJ family two-component response regulator